MQGGLGVTVHTVTHSNTHLTQSFSDSLSLTAANPVSLAPLKELISVSQPAALGIIAPIK